VTVPRTRTVPGSLAATWQDHGPACWRLARLITGTDDLAEEAVTQAIAIWQQSRAARPPEPGNPRADLLALTHRQAVQLARTAASRPPAALAAQALDPQPGQPDASPIGAALAALPPAQRQLLALAWAGGYTQAEIARLADIPLAEVRSSLHAAMRALHAALAGADPGRIPAQEATA
jgi:DNA-directed RNA polymerase specialized sigma24 family protein